MLDGEILKAYLSNNPHRSNVRVAPSPMRTALIEERAKEFMGTLLL
jgi:hypothetical protein